MKQTERPVWCGPLELSWNQPMTLLWSSLIPQSCNIIRNAQHLFLFKTVSHTNEGDTEELVHLLGNQRFGNLAPPAGVAEWVGFLCSGSLHHKHVYWSGRCSRTGSLCTVFIFIRTRDHTEFLVPRSTLPPSCCRIIF